MSMRASRVVAATAAGVLVAGAALAACGGGGDSRARTGKEIYVSTCLTCHGADGQGGVGPQLAGVVADKYPDIADQIAVISNGTGRMPAFRGSLSAAEIRRVAMYERTKLGS